MIKSLHRLGSELASPARQKEWLSDARQIAGGRFEQTLVESGQSVLSADGLHTLQVNVGKVCNQTCAHCHVDAGPDRRESMTAETANEVMRFFLDSPIETLDITGGAPEMNPQFRGMVERARAAGRHVIDRCNLTILSAAGFRDLPRFLARNHVTIIASLPCYLEKNCDEQRGSGTFAKSIDAIRTLNELGYGIPDSSLALHLVYNPVGVHLPPPQAQLEADYRKQLLDQHGIVFSKLFTITNMPISRYLDHLIRTNQYVGYMERLMAAFNPRAIPGLMCREMVSVDWNGYLYDCDFNQMLDLPLVTGRTHIREATWESLRGRKISTGNHCFGCTAGCGSSCNGTILGAT